MYCKNHGMFKILAGFAIFFSCSTTKKSAEMNMKPQVITSAVPVDTVKSDGFLEALLKSHPEYFDSILKYQKEWNVQIIYTQVDRGLNGMPALKNHYFNVNPAKYFYP